MSNSDGFIEEVNEEVRRDRLFGLMRRWGWVPILLVVLAVGGTAWNEWRKAQERATAQALGDAIVAAVRTPAPADRLEALRAVEELTQGTARAPLALLEAGAQLEAGDVRGAVATLEPLTTDPEMPAVYRDLAALRLVSLGAGTVPLNIRTDLIEQISAAGAPYRVLGLEQRALLELEQGQGDAAIATLQSLMQESDVTDAALQRAAQLLAALGAEAPSAGTQ